MNRKMLKVELFAQEKTYRQMAKVIGKSLATVQNKMSGESEFSCAEACLISKWLELPPQKSVDIFLT